MLKKILLVILLTSSTLCAQTLPIAAHLVWTQADLLTASVTDFTVQPDSNALVHVDPSTCQQVVPFTCSLSILITSFGSHTYTITAFNLVGASQPTVFQTSVLVPGKPANVKITVP